MSEVLRYHERSYRGIEKLCKLTFYKISLSSIRVRLRRASPKTGKSLEKAIAGVHAKLWRLVSLDWDEEKKMEWIYGRWDVIEEVAELLAKCWPSFLGGWWYHSLREGHGRRTSWRTGGCWRSWQGLESQNHREITRRGEVFAKKRRPALLNGAIRPNQKRLKTEWPWQQRFQCHDEDWRRCGWWIGGDWECRQLYPEVYEREEREADMGLREFAYFVS